MKNCGFFKEELRSFFSSGARSQSGLFCQADSHRHEAKAALSLPLTLHTSSAFALGVKLARSCRVSRCRYGVGTARVGKAAPRPARDTGLKGLQRGRKISALRWVSVAGHLTFSITCFKMQASMTTYYESTVAFWSDTVCLPRSEKPNVFLIFTLRHGLVSNEYPGTVPSGGAF